MAPLEGPPGAPPSCRDGRVPGVLRSAGQAAVCTCAPLQLFQLFPVVPLCCAPVLEATLVVRRLSVPELVSVPSFARSAAAPDAIRLPMDRIWNEVSAVQIRDVSCRLQDIQVGQHRIKQALDVLEHGGFTGGKGEDVVSPYRTLCAPSLPKSLFRPALLKQLCHSLKCYCYKDANIGAHTMEFVASAVQIASLRSKCPRQKLSCYIWSNSFLPRK